MTHRSVLWPAKRVTGTESIIFSVKNQENAWLLLESLEKWLSYKLRRFLMFLIFFILFNPFSLGKTEKLDFWDSNNSTNFKHQQVTTNMTAKYLNVLQHNRTKSSPDNFSQYIAKILPTSYFGYFEHVWPLPSKKIIPNCRNCDVYLHAKIDLRSWLPFWDIVKILQTCYFE